MNRSAFHSWQLESGSRFHHAFGALILAQAVHSTEEYLGRLWETFPPARFITGLISHDLEQGFIILNVAFVAFGVWTYLVPVRRQWPSAIPIVWFWAVLEVINAVGHTLWSVRQGGYTPGVATAPVLLVLSIYLFSQLARTARATAHP
jgi:Protein of unknown function with HXXEE motif